MITTFIYQLMMSVRRWLRISWPFVLLSLCSCAGIANMTASNMMATTSDPFMDAVAEPGAQPSAKTHPQIPHASISPPFSSRSFGPQQLVRPGTVRLTRDDLVAAGALQFAQAEQRVQIGPEDNLAIPISSVPKGRSDEYILQGGDRDHPVHYDDFNRLGLETEDTIAEYKDHLGKSYVKPTNKIAVYAPRFGAVSTITDLNANMTIHRVVGTHNMAAREDLRSRLAIDNRTQRGSSQSMRMRSRGSQLDAKAISIKAENSQRLAQHDRPEDPRMTRSYLVTSDLDQTNAAYISARIQAAANWTHDRRLIILAKDDQRNEHMAVFRPKSIVGSEDEKLTKGDMHIVKSADKAEARPGDVITFTIRFENRGDHKLNEIRIVDNLSPRLTYVEDSASSDRPGDLLVEDNDEGSLILTFVLDDPLPGKETGVISFQAEVK